MTDNDQIFAFVLMPFSTAFDDVYKLGIKETAASVGITAERVDEQIFQEGMLERIYRQIEVADVVIADMTGQNPNVFYEVGYAHAKGKLCILLTQRAEDIPFDLKHYRHIVYGSSVIDLRSRLTEELNWAKQQVQTLRSSGIKVKISEPYGSVEKTRFAAYVDVSFKIDLHNEGASISPEIDSVYFYTGKGWTLTQDGRECPRTSSDLTQFAERHFLTAPVRRLSRNGWAQLKFSARRLVATTLKGDRLQDSYRISGTTVTRIVTPEGTFDYPATLEVEAEEIPF
jgi:hypothetical protein